MMHATRFDAAARRLAEHKLSRREAVRQGSLGLALAALGAGALRSTAAAAQDDAAANPRNPQFLFVQSFQNASLTPKDGAAGAYTLTLGEGLGQTLYFSDRPDRIVGTLPTEQWLDSLGFTPDNPPNAALAAQTADGEEQLLVVELRNPIYDAAQRQLSYDVILLLDAGATEMRPAPTPVDVSEAQNYSPAHLFIDDWLCSDHHIYCSAVADCAYVGDLGDKGWCSVNYNQCTPCDGWDHFDAECATRFPDQCGGGQCMAHRGEKTCPPDRGSKYAG